ncbi:recombinase family protein [Clostridium tagluense]|uniref:recombinase family protein n=1 Tax=Clostridium tagluense TaxID=360422 RepID=UPI001C0DCCF1|nr:recombinase family protein [Clostridium tagluense]MBU3129074.1 recombinase family protein [Clostridium tagluense]
MKQAIAYTRVSTDEQIKGFSLDVQLRDITAFCKENDYTLINHYEDAGQSGSTIEGRPSFVKMLSDIKNKQMNINAVIVWDFSRFSRDYTDTLYTNKQLQRMDIALISVKENINTENESDLMNFYFRGMSAEADRKKIVDRTNINMRARALTGRWNGGVVYGYNPVNKELVVNHNEAEIVKRIFKLYTKGSNGIGWGYKKIADNLNKEGIKTRNGNYWSINSIKTIIINPLYSGSIRWGLMKDWKKKRRKGKTDNFVLVKGIHTAIISVETWENTVTISKSKSHTPIKVFDGNYILTGLLKCPACGTSMISHRIKKRDGSFYRYYQCSSFHNSGVAMCNSNLVVADYAEENVIQRLIDITNNPNIIRNILENANKKSNENLKPLKNELKQIEETLLKYSSQNDKILNLYLEERLTKEDFNKKYIELQENMNSCISKKTKLTESIDMLSNSTEIDEGVVIHSLNNFRLLFDTADIEKRKKLLHMLVKEITISKGKTTKERTISKIKLMFEPDIFINQALTLNKNFVPICDTVPHLLF